MYARLVLLAVLLLAAAPASAQTETVRDSVRMELLSHQYAGLGTSQACGAGIYAIWPNVLQDLLGASGRTYGYHDYDLVATDGMFVPRGYGEQTSRPEVDIFVPPGYVGHNPQIAGGSLGPNAEACARAASAVASSLAGSWGLLNARPFRITEWYAVYSVPDGAAIALFEWEQAESLAVDFDASFESEQSREIDVTAPGKKRPVVSYSWDFGDGETGSGARPTHTYDEPGEYVVRLTVTDDDGDEASREETVTVHANHLTVEVVSATEEVTQGDTLEVVGRVTNTGREPIFFVYAERAFTNVTRLPEELDVEGAQTFYLQVDALDVPEGEEEHVERDRLEPGESIEVTRRYLVSRLSHYRNIRVDQTFRPEDIYLDWTGLFGVKGETPEEEQVEVREPCVEAEEPCATTLIEPLHVNLEVRTFTTEDVAPVETATVRAGLIVGPRPALPVVNGKPTKFVDHRVGVDGEQRCRTGCIDVEVLATDRDTGEPLPGLKLELSHPNIDGGEVVTPDQGGGYICDRGDAKCGQKIELTTDDDGVVKGYLAVPGVIDAKGVTVTASTVLGQASPYNHAVGESEHDVTIVPNVLYDMTLTLSPEDADRLAGGSALRSGVDILSDPTGLTAALKKECQLIAGGFSDGGGKLLTTDPLSGEIPKAMVDWLCGKVKAPSNQLLDLGKQSSIIPLMRWFFNAAPMPSDYLGESHFQMAFPFVSHTSQFVDELVKAVDAQLITATKPPSLPAGPVPFTLYEVSYLRRNTIRPEPTLWSALYLRLWNHTVLVDQDYLAPNWLLERALAEERGPRMLDGPADAGDPSLSMSPPPSSGPSAPSSLARASAAPSSGSAAAALRPDSLFAGAIVALSPEHPERAELAFVVAVTGEPATGQTAELAAPLVHSHPAGAALYAVRGMASTDVPAPYTLAPVDSVEARGMLALSWTTLRPVAEVDLQVARDSVFADIVLEETFGGAGLADGAHALAIGEGGVSFGVPYYWRVRARDLAGESAWSDATGFVVSEGASGVAVEEEEAPVPEAFALEANYPNPFNPQTTIGFALPDAAEVRLVVYDVIGREVAVLVHGRRAAGRHEVVFDAAGLPTGLYVYRLDTGSFAETRRMLLVK